MRTGFTVRVALRVARQPEFAGTQACSHAVMIAATSFLRLDRRRGQSKCTKDNHQTGSATENQPIHRIFSSPRRVLRRVSQPSTLTGFTVLATNAVASRPTSLWIGAAVDACLNAHTVAAAAASLCCRGRRRIESKCPQQDHQRCHAVDNEPFHCSSCYWEIVDEVARISKFAHSVPSVGSVGSRRKAC